MIELTVDRLLSERAATHGDATLLRFAAADLMYAEVDDGATAVAHGLADLGVRRGDLVAMLVDNRPEFVLTWFGALRLGAVAAPVNTAFRGAALAHALNLTRARVLVADAAALGAVAEIAEELADLRVVVVCGDDRSGGAEPVPWRSVPWAELAAAGRRPIAAGTANGDLAMLMFTSGTTGRSKGCELSHRYVVRHAELLAERLALRRDDVLYTPFPLFHLDASVLTVMPALVLGATAALGERFSVSRFWDEIRAFGATVFDFMGATLTLLHKAPPRPGDGDNPARLAWGVPLPELAPAFEARFGLELVELYGLTDAGVVMYPPPGGRVPGSCGRPIDVFDVRLVDEHDHEVAHGDVGEIVVRPLEPHLTSEGYHRMPEATLASRRNLWFHTGDLARRDADGNHFFVGRRTEVIRRRGENISAFEVEEVVDAHPAVLEVAAYGVPSELTEEDLMVAVVPRPGAAIDPRELLAFCAGRMARHMIPRYVDVVASLPRTPTEKVEKYRLAERGITATTFDREADPARDSVLPAGSVAARP